VLCRAEGAATVSMTFLEDDGRKVQLKAPLGKSLLEVAHDNDVELEGELNS
jgi:ferredoxin